MWVQVRFWWVILIYYKNAKTFKRVNKFGIYLIVLKIPQLINLIQLFELKLYRRPKKMIKYTHEISKAIEISADQRW